MTPHERNVASPLALQLSSAPSGNHYPESTVDYFTRFSRVDEHLNTHIHPTVNQAAAVNSKSQPGLPPKWLTDHGPDHIATVIQRASLLCCGPQVVLESYEIYLLLMAIHFHDVGNIFGRDSHERKITDIMNKLDEALIGSNKLEHRMIRDIAMVHGGEATVGATTTQDTIGTLQYSIAKRPRIPLIAAILRFADELADDCTRTSRFFIQNAIPPEAQAYHLYADRLRRVRVDTAEHEIELVFEINEAVAREKIQKDASKVYLFDEILRRTAKTFREFLYFARFTRHVIHIDHISVAIKILTDDYMRVRGKILYVLREQGYPPTVSIASMCPDITCKNGKELAKYVKTLGPGVEGAE